MPFETPSNLRKVVAIASGASHALAPRANGQVVAWGNNNYGQTNVPPGLSDVIAIAAGLTHSVALTADRQLVQWGEGEAARDLPQILPGYVTAIAAGSEHSLALMAPGGRLPPRVFVRRDANRVVVNWVGSPGPWQLWFSERLGAESHWQPVGDPAWVPWRVLPADSGNRFLLIEAR